MVEQIIMRSGRVSASNLDIEKIQPASGESFSEQLESCISQLSEFIYPKGETRYFITQQTFFIAASSRKEYDDRSAQILRELEAHCGTLQPATSIVAQPPEKGSDVVLELMCTRSSEDIAVRYKSMDGRNYTVVEQDGVKMVHAGGLTGNPGESILDSSERAFTLLMKILETEHLTLDDIVRQWNYIESIAIVEGVEREHQNYQVFNDVRAKYYNRGSFANGYPAATGIGMNTGGVVIGFLAVSPHAQVEVKAIQNPGQIDAHRYSDLVLRGTAIEGMTARCTPKFERAKLVTIAGLHHIYVSGTASILGEKTVHVGDVEKQTLTTIENIKGLFSKENQNHLGLSFDVSKIQFSHLRVYVKYQDDIPAVRRVCEAELLSSSMLFLESDVCREDLLVEIEGVFSL
ncbi:MAG: hypothetical protein R2751_07855 [Bacteroidales bacterium]